MAVISTLLLGGLAALALAQMVWGLHVHFKFMGYARLAEKACARFERGHVCADRAVMGNAHEATLLYLRAEELAHDDMFISPLRWPERWNADYVAEARAASYTLL